jgi:hypothetical protein
MARSSELLPQPLAPVISSEPPSGTRKDSFSTNTRSLPGACTVRSCRFNSLPSSRAMPAVGGSASSTAAIACSRSMPATKRDRLSKLSMMSDTAPSTAAKAPPACTACPTSRRPDSTSLASTTAGTSRLTWLKPRWNRFRPNCARIRRRVLSSVARSRCCSWWRSCSSPP